MTDREIMTEVEIMNALDDEINSCIENHCEEAASANIAIKNMILRLQRENAELRECLELCMKAMCQFCREASPGVVCFHGCEYMKLAKKALEREEK